MWVSKIDGLTLSKLKVAETGRDGEASNLASVLTSAEEGCITISHFAFHPKRGKPHLLYHGDRLRVSSFSALLSLLAEDGVIYIYGVFMVVPSCLFLRRVKHISSRRNSSRCCPKNVGVRVRYSSRQESTAAAGRCRQSTIHLPLHQMTELPIFDGAVTGRRFRGRDVIEPATMS